MFTPEMLASVKKVEATRQERLGMEPRRMTAEEKDALLKAYHPDYREDGFDTIKIGPNKGEKVPKELGHLLHSNSRLLHHPIDLTKIDYDTDVLIIGGGGAGASAAIEADNAGAKVMIVTKLRIGDANTMMAEGGIQAADKENDSPVQHYLDAFGGGHFAARPELLRRLVMEAPDAIKWLNELGVMFDKTEDGTMVTTHGGGTSRKRMHACKDYSGAEIMRTLRDEVINRGIPVVEFTSAVELIKDEKGQVAGAVLLNMETGDYMVARAKTVIIATGAHPRPIGCKNEGKFVGKGISFCATCDAAFFEGMEVYVVGGGDAAVEEAMYLTKFARKVTIIHRRNELRAAKSIQEKAFKNEKLHFMWDTVVDEVDGDEILTKMVVKNVKTGELTTIEADEDDGMFGLFGFIGLLPNTALYEGQVNMENGYIPTDDNMHTNLDGVYAAGDLRVKSLRQVVTAAADGAIAAMQAEKYIADHKE